MRRQLRALTLWMAVALAATACTSSAPVAGDGEQVLRVFGNHRGADAEAFRMVLDEFTRQTGIGRASCRERV